MKNIVICFFYPFIIFYYNPDTRTFFYQLFPKSRAWGKYAVGVKLAALV